MSGGNDGNGGWGSRFMKVAGAAAATAAVAGGLYALLSSSSAATEAPFGAQRQRREAEEDDGGPWSRRATPSHVTNEGDTVKWKKPEIGWVKVNVDGSRDHEGPTAGCGGVVRDAWGTWLIGFSQKLDPTNKPHETELQAILTGLELALKMNFEKVVVESDCEPAVRMVESGLGSKFQRPEYEVVQRIKNLILDHEWQVEVVYVPRNANRLADKLANDARKLSSYDLCKYLSVPDNCKQLFLEDNGQLYVGF